MGGARGESVCESHKRRLSNKAGAHAHARPPRPQAHRRRMRLWRGVARAAEQLVRLQQRAAARTYAPDGAGYGEVRGEFQGIQRDEAEAREAKWRRAGGPSA